MITYRFPATGRLAMERLAGEKVMAADGSEWVEVRVAGDDGGPGTELAEMLAGFPLYIKAAAGCQCKKRALVMNANERAMPGWCEKNIATIVGWLQEEYEKRSLPIPFSSVAARQLVKLAIRRARRGIGKRGDT